MKIRNKLRLLNPRRLRNLLRRRVVSRKDLGHEPTLRSELFSAEQMERHGVSLAGQHRLSERRRTRDLLLTRLANNEAVLTNTCAMLTVAARAQQRVTPAGEWLLDNFYLIEEQIRTAQRHLPADYSRELPQLGSGPSAQLPRVYDIALEIISHGDGRVDAESLSRFVTAYQTVSPLALGELWAIPIMLRLALIENLRRVAARVTANWRDRDLARSWSDRMAEVAGGDPKSVVLVVADMARSNPPMNSSFVAELARRLQSQGPALALPLTWIEQRLSESALSIEHLVHREAQLQAADQVSISNSIGSLRELAAIDWRDFVESVSIVEHRLRQDPAGIYPGMDFATRDHYRHVVESLARSSKRPEPEVADTVIELGTQVTASGNVPALTSHVGYYLVDKGKPELERRLGARLSTGQALHRLIDRAPLPIYLGLVSLLTLLFARALVLAAHPFPDPLWLLVLIGLAALVAGSQLAIGLVNWMATLATSPRMLPRMDYDTGIPASARTLVAVPCMIGSTRDVDELTEALEVRFLGNRDPHLHFALLTDFPDAPSEAMPGDTALLAQTQQRIEALNARHAGERGNRFFLLHRPRHWSPAERVWMGRERKRGKLADLNALLRGKGKGRFALTVGDIAVLQDVRYVITLDTDTQLPRDSAREFVATLDHPLNHAVHDSHRQRVVSGYGILQPRVGISLPSTSRSRYAQLFGSDAGIDPYSRMTSDVYQDVFGEGSFIGKGIYNVDAFEHALAGRFPDNRILSHDLVEGCYARSGLLSDVQLYEEYPAHYKADVRRRHRWIRGDWQLLPWLLPWQPTAQRGLRRNPLSPLSRWKILDNLRRSLLPPALLILLVLGWLTVDAVAEWTAAVLIIVFTLPLLSSLLDIVQKPRDVLLEQHLLAALRASTQHFVRAGLALVWLPHETLYNLDAIMRTLWRMFVSRRRLLQWSPSREVERMDGNDLTGVYRSMWIAPTVAVVLAVVLSLVHVPALAVAAPFLLSWLLAPTLAWWMSAPRTRAAFAPGAARLRFLRRLARKTWAFFEAHVDAENHWLPPDNIQEQPAASIAHRTSPTNMGMALLADLSAWDFGYISGRRLLERCDATLSTMQTLPRYRSHFYNWYDTRTLQPLAPLYISTVDSGNLAGHLLTLAPGLRAVVDQPVFAPRMLQGLADTVDILLSLSGTGLAELDAWQKQLDGALTAPPTTLHSAATLIGHLNERAHALAMELVFETDSDGEFWTEAWLHQCDDLHAQLDAFDTGETSGEHAGSQAMPTLRQLAAANPQTWPDDRRTHIEAVRRRATEQVDALERLAQLANDLAQMDVRFLYDAERELLSIGYNVNDRRLDAGYYDLLASEARLANFVAIAQGQLPQESWFNLGRLLTSSGGEPVLLSWTGSMFEYLMPMLVMPSYEGTLLDQTCRAAVNRQIEYGRQRGLPWGVSESGYNTLDAHFIYQYRAFGVPGLGLKRGLGEDMVIAPYASALALMVDPEAATQNLKRLADQGVEGRYGLYEAVDYTPARLPRGQDSALVQSFMAHHQGMSLLALAHALLDQPMQRRFAADPQFQATMLLLQERVPRTSAEYMHTSGFPDLHAPAAMAETRLRVFTDADRPRPALQLLSNGSYHVMVSSSGGGYSRCRELAVTRWREDITRDHWGTFGYLRDVASGVFWSTTHQPTRRKTELYEAIFSDARAEFRVREQDFDTHTEIVVSPEDNIELRRTRITNRGRSRRTIEFTSYAEVVLAPAISDAMHPAFSNLFVQTELLRPLQAIVCSRRPRSADEKVPWMCHLLAVHDADIDEISYETDRARFIGRGRSTADPQALDADDTHIRLSDSAGPVLDPIVAIRCRISLEPEQSATIDMVTGIGTDRANCVHLIGKYRDRHLADRVFDLAWTHSQVSLRQLNTSLADAQLYEHMATAIVYANEALRAEPDILADNRRGQSGLWGQSISGDLPIVLLKIADPARIDLVRQLVQAHAYWRLKGLVVDLVIWNEDHAGYRQQLNDLIMGLIASGSEANLIDRSGGIFVRPAQQISNEDRLLVQAAARVVLVDSRGTLAEQIGRRRPEIQLPAFEPSRARRAEAPVASPEPQRGSLRDTLQLGSPYGGFSADGSEYVMELVAGQNTPAPWANVLANPDFGTVISESGSAYTWGENAHEFRLSPWHNDPVGDPSGEALYLRDEETGHYWSPSALPCRGEGTYMVRHGFGYSVFEHSEDGIDCELWVYVALDASVKFSVLKLHNRSGRERRLSATGYVEWLLGDLREKSAMHVVTESDPHSGALLARNAWNTEFPGRVAFFDTDEPRRTVSGDRTEFIGRNGSLGAPAALSRARLSGRLGPGLDPCAAIQIDVDLDVDEQRDVVFRLGVGHDASAASALALRFRGARMAADELEAVRADWRRILGTVQVHTPDPAVDVLTNGWLMYQTIACRFRARSGYYQSGGAFGFRDQLQDSMAMIHAAPESTRQHLLLCAAHQFVEGDVQHWWHPPLGRGVRTRCSDDYLWLPLATSRYVLATGDTGVLDEMAGYIEGRPVSLDEESYYDLPMRSERRETLYAHCVRAIEHGLRYGERGLPLMGSGDWNDGMNRVGERGRGESVWLGFFLHDVLTRFAGIARLRNDEAFAVRCEQEAANLRENLQRHAWDGAWYRRAWFDDGTPLGSSDNEECRIDSVAQSWAVLSGAGDKARQRVAMASLDHHLVHREAGLVQLLQPPFDSSGMDPGYIKGYVPGVRENGGQYTHAAIWATMAFAELGDSTRAWELLHMINPVTHGTERVGTYMVEPYVVSADVYAVDPHVGRGGWSWYTGSAGWMYRLITESLLGLRREGERLAVTPLLPADWPAFTLEYRYRDTLYRIEVSQTDATTAPPVRVDGVEQTTTDFPLVDDGGEHAVDIRVPRRR